jgi:plasmid stabilization system protein ParE
MKALRVRRLAKIEIDDAFDWYESREPGVGVAFLDEINNCLKQIQQNPLLYVTTYRSTHRALLDVFPYALLYRVTKSSIILISCKHVRRNPDEWMQLT